MRARWWPQEKTFVVTWGVRSIIVGLTGKTRPSLMWHLRKARWWRRD